MNKELIKEVADFLKDVGGKQADTYSKLLNDMLDEVAKSEHEEKVKEVTTFDYVIADENAEKQMFFRNEESKEKYKGTSNGLTLDEAILDSEYWWDLRCLDSDEKQAYLILKGWKRRYDSSELFTHKRHTIGETVHCFDYWDAFDDEMKLQRMLADPDKIMKIEKS